MILLFLGRVSDKKILNVALILFPVNHCYSWFSIVIVLHDIFVEGFSAVIVKLLTFIFMVDVR